MKLSAARTVYTTLVRLNDHSPEAAAALEQMRLEVERLESAYAGKDPAKFVIRYDDGAYNRDSGHPVPLSEASLHDTSAEAQSVAEGIMQVERILTLGEAIELDSM